jgi:flagellar FliL protein
MSTPATAAPARKKSKKPLLVVVAVVALVAAGAGGFLVMHKKNAAPAKPVQHEAVYLQLDPSFVVNFQDERALRFLQVGVNVMSHDPDALVAVKELDPVIRNALLMLFSGQDATTLVDVKGKQKLQADALAAVQKVVREKTGKPGVDALYFTSFIMQ